MFQYYNMNEYKITPNKLVFNFNMQFYVLLFMNKFNFHAIDM